MIGCVNTPSSNSARQADIARIGSPISTGITGVCVAPRSKPSARRPSATRVGVVPQPLAAIRLLAKDVERGQHTGDRRGWHARGEDERSTVVAEIVYDVLLSGDHAADRRERLENVARMRSTWSPSPEMAGGAGAVVAEHAERVRFVDEERAAPCSLLTATSRGQVDDAAFHREHAVGHDELAQRPRACARVDGERPSKSPCA